MTYASPEDARVALGKLGDRLPSTVDVDAFVAMAHAEAIDRLARTYTTGIPVFEGDAREAVRWAEAKLAGSAILELLRAQDPNAGAAARDMRESAYATLDDGVVGYPPEATDTDPDTPGMQAASSAPRVSSYTGASMFPDPYDELRGDPDLPRL